MPIHKITSLVDTLNAKLIFLLCHQNADPDAVCAAFAFSRLLERLRPGLKVEIGAAEGPSRLSKHILKSFPVKLKTQLDIDEADLIVLLDTNTIQQLGAWSERVKASGSAIVVVDHHASHPETERLATLYMTDETVSSTCEIVYRFFKQAEVELNETEAKALFLGIAFDTRHFVIATSATLKIVVDLIDVGVNVQETLSLLSLPMMYPERIARIKACRRMKLVKIREWLIAFSHVSAYQASAARALIGLGAHLAIVAGQKGKTLQVSLRSSQDLNKITGIHLGRDLAQPLGEYLHGMGGGHSVSAGANGIGDFEASLKLCVTLLKQRLK